MNISNILYDTTNSFLTTTTRPIRNSYVKKNPFDSWYIGGILFMCTIIFVLLYANHYRENSYQIFCIRLLTKLRIIPPLPTSSITPARHHANDPLLI
jgi:hypothetical protein